jgi:hypothetical protein
MQLPLLLRRTRSSAFLVLYRKRLHKMLSLQSHAAQADTPTPATTSCWPVLALVLALLTVLLSADVTARARASYFRSPQPPAAGEPHGHISRRNMIVVSHFDEDLSWLFEFVEAVDDKASGSRAWSATVYTKQEGAASTLEREVAARGLTQDASQPGLAHIRIVREAENWGDEAVPYLRFITSQYDALPPLALFVHGAPHVHSPFLRHMVDCVKPIFDGYYAVGNPFVNECRPITGADTLYGLLDAQFNANLATAGLSHLRLVALRNVSFYAAAQFIVSRGTIQRHPLAYWEAVLATALKAPSPPAHVLNGERAGKIPAYWLENSWHAHFTGRYGERWRTYNETCGSNANAAAPLSQTCCEKDEHMELFVMLHSEIVQRTVGGRVWQRHRAHPPKGNE